jgi:hypothetical protein
MLSGARPGATLHDNSFDQRHDEPFLLPGPSKVDSSKPASQYAFPIKLSDKYRWFDGLVGCFAANPAGTAKAESNLNLDTMHTYFTNSTMPSFTIPRVPDPREPLNASAITTLSPFYVPAVADSIAFNNKRNSNLNVYGLIVDPFLAVHAYTEILPLSTLKLPPWTLQKAMERMTAFFHMGPMIVTSDVPTYNSDRELRSETYRIKDDDSTVVPRVYIPVVGTADWN